MGEYAYAALYIGGRVDEEKLRELLEEHEPDLLAELDEAIENLPGTKTLELIDEDASYAMFSSLEDALVDAGIAFDRESSAVDDCPEETRSWRPGMAEPYDAVVSNGEDLCSVAQVRQRLDDPVGLRQWLDANHPVVPDLEPCVLVRPVIITKERRRG